MSANGRKDPTRAGPPPWMQTATSMRVSGTWGSSMGGAAVPGQMDVTSLAGRRSLRSDEPVFANRDMYEAGWYEGTADGCTWPDGSISVWQGEARGRHGQGTGVEWVARGQHHGQHTPAWACGPLEDQGSSWTG
jgi:hypothetical protein